MYFGLCMPLLPTIQFVCGTSGYVRTRQILTKHLSTGRFSPTSLIWRVNMCEFDCLITEKQVIMNLIDSGRLFQAYGKLVEHFDNWCSNEYAYKGTELCERLYRKLNSDRMNRNTEIKRLTFCLGEQYQTAQNKYMYV